MLTPRTEKNLSECRPELKTLFSAVAKVIPLEVFVGKRDKATQDKLFAEGKSKVKYPDSKHNKEPLSWAVDVMPLPLSFDPKKRNDLIFFAGIVFGIASQLGIKVRWGGDWNSNKTMQDEHFPDLYHFELIE